MVKRPRPVLIEDILSNLPTEILKTIADFCIEAIKEASAFSAVSTKFHNVSSIVLNMDGNSPVWENEFRMRDPDLYESYMEDTSDRRSTWRRRLEMLVELNNLIAQEWVDFSIDIPRIHPAAPSPLICNTVLRKDPKYGFQVNLGTTYERAAVIWSVSGTKDRSKSSAMKFTRQHKNLPVIREMPTTTREMELPSKDLLVLLSLNGILVSSHQNVDDLMKTVRSAGELSRWRYLCFADSNPGEVLAHGIPNECLLGS